MNSSSRQEAQRRADDIRVFHRELERLTQEGALSLTVDQQAAVRAHHDRLLATFSSAFDIDRDAKSKQLSWGMRIASFLGALALAASVFFLFYQFWGLIPTTAQVALLIAASLGTSVGTFWVDRLDHSGYFTKLAAMVAFACFVLNIVMLGQIYNITPSDKALIPWAAFALLLAYVFDLRLLLVVGILCAVAWVSARTGTFSGLYWLSFGQRPENFFPAAALLFLVPLWTPHARFPGFPATYRVFALLTLFLPTLVLANWGRASYLSLDPDVVEGIYQLLGFVGTAVFVWLGLKQHWPEVVNTAVTLFVIFLYTKFFDWWWAIMPKYLFFFVVALTAVLFLMVLKRLRAAGDAHVPVASS